MGIVIEGLNPEFLEEYLLKKGFKKSSFDGNLAYIKESDEALWVALPKGNKCCFISLPEEENPALHSREVNKLCENIEDLIKEVNND